MGQIIGLAARLFDPCLFGGKLGFHGAAGTIGRAHRLLLRPKPGKDVEQLAMRLRLDQGAIIVLAVNFNEFAGDRPQGLRTDRLVVDESAGAPIFHLDPAQDQGTIDVDTLALRRDQRRVARRHSNTAVTWPCAAP